MAMKYELYYLPLDLHAINNIFQPYSEWKFCRECRCRLIFNLVHKIMTHLMKGKTQMLGVSFEEPECLPACLLFAGTDSFVWICFGTRIEYICIIFFATRMKHWIYYEDGIFCNEIQVKT